MTPTKAACPVGAETTISLRILLTLVGLVLASFGSFTALAGWFVDAKVQSSTNEILNVIKDQNILIDARITALEHNVVDRWTLTNEYQLMMEFQESLKEAGVNARRINPYDIKRQASK